MFSNIEEPYDKLSKQLNSAITKLLYCFYRRLKMEEMQKLQKLQYFSLLLNLQNLLERACNHIKLYIFLMYTWKCVKKSHIQLLQNTRKVFFDALKTGQNKKSYIFQEVDI